MKTSPQHCEALDYGFLLLAHVICADQQIHSQESRALRDLANQTDINELTLQEMDKILGQDDTQITLEESAQNVLVGQRSEVLRQVLAIAYIDGYFSPLEREVVNKISQLWGIDEHAIEQMLEDAQGFRQGRTRTDFDDEENGGLSVGAQLLKDAKSVFSKLLISKLTELAPAHIGEKIEQLQREILLSGPEYDDAIQQCAKVARENFEYADRALKIASSSLQDLGIGLQEVIDTIKQKAIGQGEYQTAKDIAKQLEQTQQSLSAKTLRDLEAVRQALLAKQRALDHFSIAFMGRTKAGKSTLHAVITGEGWSRLALESNVQPVITECMSGKIFVLSIHRGLAHQVEKPMKRLPKALLRSPM